MANLNLDEKYAERSFIMDGVEYKCPKMTAKMASRFQKKASEIAEDDDTSVFRLAEILADILEVAKDTFYDADLRKIRAAMDFIFDVEDFKKKEEK